MTVQPTEESVRVFLAGHLAMAGNALTELSQVVSDGQLVTQAMINQVQRCDAVVDCAWSAFIYCLAVRGVCDWEGAMDRLNHLDTKLARLDQRQEEVRRGRTD